MMPRLQIQLLGTCQLLYHDEAVTTMQQARTQSLLAYLLLHRNSPQSRQQLAFHFWPETSDAQALTNLRRELHHLRHSLPDADHYLQIDPRTVQWRANASFKLDVADFEALLEQANQAAQAGRQAAVRAALAGALALYQGRLLPTCYDDWILSPREQLERRFERGLEQLIVLLEEQRDYLTAIHYAQQMLHHDALHEPTYRRLMRLHALNGDRASALRVYHTCASILQRELEVAPNQETQAAYARLLNLDRSPGLPAQPAAADRSVVRLIGRQAEWQQLRTAWRKAVQGQAHFVLVAGEAGIGKTRLAEELFESVRQQGIVAARARSYAAEGARAYAPMIEWLRAEHLRSTLDQLDDVWLTEVARLLPELLVERPALPRSEPLGERWQRQRLFEALARVVIGDGQPRLLLIDDLQWCDPETLEWMRYLLHYDLGARLLIVGTVRAEEIDPDHPLMALVRELQTSKQLTEVELGPLDIDDTTALAAQMAGQALTSAMMAQLYRETEGNPLFVMETMRADLSKGVEVMGSERLSYSPLALPPKIQAVIQRRLAQLSPAARELASLAAVVGRSFTLNVLVQTGDLTEDALIPALDELWQRRIIREQGGDTYDFTHDRIRDVAYASLSPIQRRHWHGRLAEVLQRVYESDLDGVSAALAIHYEQAGSAEQAIYWYQQAAVTDVRRYAYVSGIDSLNAALRLLKTLPPTAEHKKQELSILLAIASNLVITEGFATPVIAKIYAQIEALILYIEDDLLYFRVSEKLRLFYSASGDMPRAQKYAEQLHQLALRLDDPQLQQAAHQAYGVVCLQLGRFSSAKCHYLRAETLLSSRSRFDPEIVIHEPIRGPVALPLTLWLLGYPDQAVARTEQLLRFGEDRCNPFDVVLTHFFASLLYRHMREVNRVAQPTARMLALNAQYGIKFAELAGAVAQGWLVAEQGDVRAGIAQMRAGIDGFKSLNHTMYQTHRLGLLLEVQFKASQWEAATATLDEAFAMSDHSGQRSWDADLHRLRGELLLATGVPETEAALAYERAIQLARRQNAKSLELRATISLSRLLQRQGKRTEAHDLLAPIYGWFSEGFDTPDLQAAQALLDALPEHP